MASLTRAFLSYKSTQCQLHRRTIGLGPNSSLCFDRSSQIYTAKFSAATRCPAVLVPRAASAEVPIADRVAEEVDAHGKVLRVGVICGGPSAERGISLNSARSVIDHIQGDDLHVSCYYIDTELNAYGISTAQVYSNTPSDFDFKLESLAQVFMTLSDFAEHLATTVDIVFPVIHGQFGEDGGIQELLEKFNVPFVGTGSHACRQAFDKHEASLELCRQGYMTVPNFLVQEGDSNEAQLSNWFSKNQLDIKTGKVVVKPARAGSSIGVTVAYGFVDSLRKAKGIISQEIDDKVLIEIFLEGGSEFTAIILDVGSAGHCQPVVLLPTEVELQRLGSVDVNEKDAIFNYRRKYLPTQQVAYHTPPRFPLDVIENIRGGASQLFRGLGLRDFARIDGWFLPSTSNLAADSGNTIGRSESGIALFTDINLISGMEQTSFLFQQASKVGFSHSNILRSIIHHACSRYPNITLCNTTSSLLKGSESTQRTKATRKVFVIFGGDTSERQVSLMSGTNVWLNLQAFDDIDVVPCLLAPKYVRSSTTKSDEQEDVRSRQLWLLPYSLVLRHTTEEVLDACMEAIEPARAAFTSKLRNQVMNEILEGFAKKCFFSGFDIADELPEACTLGQWVKLAKEAKATVFIAVHGGIGEDGTLQSLLEEEEIPYTGPGAAASKICMDKVATSLAINHLSSSGVLTINKDVWRREDLLNTPLHDIWNSVTSKLLCQTLCVKPSRDGCSTGVARLCCAGDLGVYAKALKDSFLRIPPNVLSKPHGMIEMPSPPPESLIFEPFIETDEIIVSSRSSDEKQGHLIWKGKSRWVEITVGVIGKRGSMHSLSPSITVKETGDILSLEEKFQGGTGINLTPPPSSIISTEALERCKLHIEHVANTLQLEGFSRIDAFLNVDTGEVLIIEVNTVPGMTPSTVLIHQALAENPPMHPHKFFRTLLDLGSERFK